MCARMIKKITGGDRDGSVFKGPSGERGILASGGAQVSSLRLAISKTGIFIRTMRRSVFHSKVAW